MAAVATPQPQPLPTAFAADNGSPEPNALERDLANGAAERIDRKEMLRRKARKALKRQWQNGNLDPMTLCKKLAQEQGNHTCSGWLGVFGDLEERDKRTIRKLAKLRKTLTDAKFGREPWEVAEEAAKRERARERARARGRQRSRARAAPAEPAEPADSDLELSEEEEE